MLHAGSKRDRSEEESLSKRTSWVRRLSIVAPSLEGSFGTPSLNRPSTPSVFSNGSNAPLFSTPTPVTPRNKLVKRSTSQRMLHSDSPSTSPFAGRSTTFRRPATSYQRSEHLRMQSVQQDLELKEHASQTPHQPLHISGDLDSNSGARSSVSQQWRPFFRFGRRKIGPEAPQRRASFSRILGGSDYICCVKSQPGIYPILVPGISVGKPQVDMARSFDSPLRILEESDFDSESEPVDGPKNKPDRKGRNSFSIADFMPSASPSTWKGNRGGSPKRRKGMSGGRRAVSAPQGSGIGTSNPNSVFPRAYANSSVPGHGESKASSSPLPPLEQMSAFEIDLPGTSSSNQTSLTGGNSAFASHKDGPLANLPSPRAGSAATRIHSTANRSSRVPSDYSTTFGSDNEHSKVFSTDGEDGEFRSETAFDSLRTDASGSSHSGARSHRVETVFGDQTPPESVKQTPSIFQEKLSRIPVMMSRRPEDFIAEEDSVKTPTRREGSTETENSTIVFPVNYNVSSTMPDSLSPVASAEFPDDPTGVVQPSIEDSEQIQSESQETRPEGFEDDWDEELGIQAVPAPNLARLTLTETSISASLLSSQAIELPERPRSNIFEWSERQASVGASQPGTSLRPSTAHPQRGVDRGGRPQGRRPTGGVHLRSQSVPVPPENSKHRFNNSAKLDSWKLGGKGENEKWDNDFEFDEPQSSHDVAAEDNTGERQVIVPKDILERQASVHGQFGQVKELSLLVEELRRLHHSASVYGILTGQSSSLWKEAEGIIDLATLDEDEPPRSPNSTSFEFDAFDEDSPSSSSRQRRSSSAREPPPPSISPAAQPVALSTPPSSRQGTPNNRPRQDSVARAKNVLENINQHRSPFDPPLEPVDERTPSGSPSKKTPFDTTSLRDLVTRAGVVTRALKEIIRKAEDPEYVPRTPERRSQSPPDPPFVSQIFSYQNSPQASPTPSNGRRDSPVAERSNGTLSMASMPTHDNDVHNHGPGHGRSHMMAVI